jgi:hypothetical protein
VKQGEEAAENAASARAQKKMLVIKMVLTGHRHPLPLPKSMKIPARASWFGKVQLPDVTRLTSAVESPAGLADDNYMRLTGLRADETTAKEIEGK